MGSSGLSPAAIVAIACNSVVGLLILILFVILYKACKVPSRPEKPPVLAMGPEQQNEHKYLLAKPREDVFSQYISQLGELS